MIYSPLDFQLSNPFHLLLNLSWIFPSSHTANTPGKLKNLPEISWLASRVSMLFLVRFVFCCLRALHHWNECLKFDDLSGQEIIRHHFPMYGFKIGHSYEAFTYLFCRNIFIRLLSASKISSVNLLKLNRVSGKFWKKWIVGVRKSRIN